MVNIICADCADELKKIPDNFIDAVVTDPPYGLSKEPDIAEVMRHWINGDDYNHSGKGFMGKTWDSFVPGPSVWKEVLRVLKPGGYAAVFAGTRTQDLMSIALRFAGFEIRDTIMWVYGSGFPKSLDVSKALDRKLGATRKVIDKKTTKSGGMARLMKTNVEQGFRPTDYYEETGNIFEITEPASDIARKYSGYGTALKPAYEPIIIARKPLIGTVAENVLEYGTGGINIDGCRVPVDETADASQTRTMNRNKRENNDGWGMSTVTGDVPQVVGENGRWPANIIHDGNKEVLAGFPITKPSKPHAGDGKPLDTRNQGWGFKRMPSALSDGGGSAARFFYCAKTTQKDRNEGLEELELKQYSHDGRNKPIDNAYQRNSSEAKNHHPTVKPTVLMRYLIRLVTPPDGTVLDPFMGSGSTGKAAVMEGFGFVGIEKEEEYVNIARSRIESQTKSAPKLDFGT